MCAVPSSRVELSFFGTVLGRDAGTDSKFGWSSSSVHHHHNHSIPMPLSPSRWCTGWWAQPGSLALIVCSACFSCTRYSSNTPQAPMLLHLVFLCFVFTWMGRWPFGTNKAHLDQMAFVGTWSSGWVDVHLDVLLDGCWMPTLMARCPLGSDGFWWQELVYCSPETARMVDKHAIQRPSCTSWWCPSASFPSAIESLNFSAIISITIRQKTDAFGALLPKCGCNNVNYLQLSRPSTSSCTYLDSWTAWPQ